MPGPHNDDHLQHEEEILETLNNLKEQIAAEKRDTLETPKDEHVIIPSPSNDRVRTEPVESIMQFFAYDHPMTGAVPLLADFHTLAHNVVKEIPRNPERTVALRKLLEAKEAMMRARYFK